MTSMRFLTFLLLGGASAVAMAAETADTFEPPPPPPSISGPDDAISDEPEVTITKQTEQTIEEYRVGGKLYMIKITPKHGKPYYLVDDMGDGKFARQESLDSGLRVPRWVIRSF